MSSLDPTTIALIVLGVTALVCALGILILKKRGSKGNAVIPELPVDPPPVKPPVPDGEPVKKAEEPPPPSDAYRSIYSFIAGSDRIICPNCGAEYNRGTAICTLCGQRL